MNIGIIGGGQLAQMLAQAGLAMTTDLELDFAFISPDKDACAATYGRHLHYPYLDQAAKSELENWSDVITYEFESIPGSLVEDLEKTKTVHPSSGALATASDRLNEKQMFNRLGIGTAEYAAVEDYEGLIKAIEQLGYPSILKTRREGYDGKGQVVIRSEEDLESALDKVGNVPCILEKMVNFSREVSAIAARNSGGDIVIYPIAQNYHREGILRLSLAVDTDSMQNSAEVIIRKVADEMQYVGVLAIELFEVDGELIANELSPRVHNSGHWTMDGSEASQFENHLRAITNQPLIECCNHQPTAMINLIGQMPPRKEIENYPATVLYDYGKAIKPGRKVGHINMLGTDLDKTVFVKNIRDVLVSLGENGLADNLAL